MNADPARPDQTNPPEEERSFSFTTLIQREYARLDEAGGPHVAPHASPSIATPGRADEPWVSFTDRDLFGVALSGGGIRSATFNLGLLQALERKQLLKNVDYLSTVSGGGYIGGFWTAWRQRGYTLADDHFEKFLEARKTKTGLTNPLASDQRHFPNEPAKQACAPSEPDIREQPEIRHLREFSRFLMPRVGFFCMETWAGIVTILGGLLPSLTAAISVLALLHYAWFYVGHCLISSPPLGSAICLGVLTLLYHFMCEYGWRLSGKDGNTRQPILHYLGFAAGAATLTAAGWYACRHLLLSETMDKWLRGVEDVWQSGATRTYPVETSFEYVLFGPAAVAALAGLLLLIFRAIASSMIKGNDAIRWSSGFDRAAARCLAPAVMWAALALVWESCHWLLHQEALFQATEGHTVAATAGSTAVFGMLFVWLRDWLTKPTEENLASNILSRLAEKLKPLVPQLLAIGFVLSMLVTVGVLVQSYGLGWWSADWPSPPVCGAGSALLLISGTLLFFDPARVGMHDFYRSRICRCFLGGARAASQANRRPTSEQFGDDLTLGEIREYTQNQRPIHLVCCAANNLAGDTLGSLYRGARSAVISPFGISLGNDAAAYDDLRYSSALTASAAAFNSQMGRVSMDMGPAVAFVMSAFNLRLGLWVPHPLMRNPRPPALVGRPFFFEMFGLTKCDPVPPAEDGPMLQVLKECTQPLSASIDSVKRYVNREVINTPARQKKAKAVAAKVSTLSHQAGRYSEKHLRDLQFLHLSDGAHFENLGLYELVRRHCRYIIVSDCGTDPEVAFDDLAIALRSIREDFGVELDLDVSPLRPDDSGRARQHAVVGTIHYDGLGGTDKGTILFFKPTLTGDEPSDVIQYQARHPAFPHETTGDQFYDEAQWESYRRLGEHAGDFILRPLAMNAGKQCDETQFVENIFLEASQRWFPAADRHSDTLVALNERCNAIETSLCENAPANIRAEFFPEVATAFTPPTAQPAREERTAAEASPLDEEVRTVHYMMLVSQLMEDAWSAADLETQWAHPLNEGWMNYFHRWAATPSFRRWWPILSPIYNVRFRNFVRDRFGIRLVETGSTVPGAKLELQPLATPDELKSGFAWKHWAQRHRPADLGKMLAFDYQLTLASVPQGFQKKSFQAGFLLCERDEDADGSFVQWHARQLFVPDSLIGSGIVTGLLEAVIAHFKKEHATGRGPDRLQVLLNTGTQPGEPDMRRDLGHRQQRVHLINFYKSRSFVMTAPGPKGTTPSMLRLQLAPGKKARQSIPIRSPKVATNRSAGENPSQ